MPKQYLNTVDALILCGGLGTRFRSVISDRPKILAPIGKETCLDILAKKLFSSGIRRIILATGYLGEQIEEYVEKTPLYKKGTVVFSREERPLGTGGALKKALPLVRNAQFLSMYGDTLFTFSLNALAHFHYVKRAHLSLAVSPRLREDSGGVILDKKSRIVAFRERGSIKEAPLMSDGIFLINVAAISKYMPRKKIFSFEFEILPQFVKAGNCFGFVEKNGVSDIGTPERYSKVAKRYRQLSL